MTAVIGSNHVLRIFASFLFLLCVCVSPLLAERVNHADDVLVDINGVYDSLVAETTNSLPAVCLIDMRHPDTVREAMKKPAGQGHLAYLDKMRTRVLELSGLRCVVIHYTQLTADHLPRTNFKALLINAMDKSINREYREQLYRIVRETRLPTIGFCGGHQLIAEAFGGKVPYMRRLRDGEADPRPSYQPGQFKEWGFMPVLVTRRDPLFDGLGDRPVVREMHAWHITKLPSEFDVLAATDECPIQAIKHQTRVLYGTQFHPEQYDDEHPDGKTILRNFFIIAGILPKQVNQPATGAPAPNVEGVVLVHQGDWPADVVETFHKVPWLDAASIRLKWSELEPRDQEFNWAPFDKLLDEVKRYNAAHPGARRTLHIRVMGGVHCPLWFEEAGVRFYDTTHRIGKKRDAPLRIPLPYDNPEFLKQLREVYRAMFERYNDEPLVTVYHGTWSAGPWDEIFHPQDSAPLPPDYTPQKFVRGMIEQLDVLIEEFCLKGKVAELPFSGKYPPKDRINITGPLTARIVERLGRCSPFIYIQSNGWGQTSAGKQTVSWGHDRDIADAREQVNLAFQALGTNKGGGWFPQGDWRPLIELAKHYDAAYLEIYPPDLMPMDTVHHIVEAFADFKEWLKQRRNRSDVTP